MVPEEVRTQGSTTTPLRFGIFDWIDQLLMSTRRAQETTIELAGTGDGVFLAGSRPSVSAPIRAISGSAL